MCVVRHRETHHERSIGRITFLHDRLHLRRLGIDFMSVVRACHEFVTRHATRASDFGIERYATILVVAVATP